MLRPASASTVRIASLASYALMIEDRPLAEVTRATPAANLSLVPADNDLAGAEIELVALDDREKRLRRILTAAPGIGDSTMSSSIARPPWG